MSFHEVRFPTGISLGSSGGPERRTEIVALGSGFEERNTRWADSRRRFDAGYGVKSLDDLYAVIEFFEERRGRLYGFRWKDVTDFKSTPPQQSVSPTDQLLGLGDGAQTEFQLVKAYGGAHAPYERVIKKPVAGSVVLAVDGLSQSIGSDFTVDVMQGVVSFSVPPAAGMSVTAGYEFDVPVRFDSDELKINLDHFSAGQIPNIPVVEIRL